LPDGAANGLEEHSKNGELLNLAEGEFDLFITADQGFVISRISLAGKSGS